MQNNPADFEVTLRANASWLQLELKGIWQYRDLLSLLVWRDFVAKYKQTILGPLWFELVHDFDPGRHFLRVLRLF